jgi:Type III flagellar switch regulator (C-ring) FliN C-term
MVGVFLQTDGPGRKVWIGVVIQLMTNANLQILPSGSECASRTQGTGVSHEHSGPAYSSMAAHPAWPMLGRLPVSIGVRIPLRGFKVRSLLSLRRGQTVASTWATTEDVPLQARALHVCWGEFEVVEQRIAIRLTRLA